MNPISRQRRKGIPRPGPETLFFNEDILFLFLKNYVTKAIRGLDRPIRRLKIPAHFGGSISAFPVKSTNPEGSILRHSPRPLGGRWTSRQCSGRKKYSHEPFPQSRIGSNFFLGSNFCMTGESWGFWAVDCLDEDIAGRKSVKPP
jgi:hypothetical protein